MKGDFYIDFKNSFFYQLRAGFIALKVDGDSF